MGHLKDIAFARGLLRPIRYTQLTCDLFDLERRYTGNDSGVSQLEGISPACPSDYLIDTIYSYEILRLAPAVEYSTAYYYE